jgi:hypothetical protein
LSYHGFLPEDFKKIAEAEQKKRPVKPKKEKKPKSVLPSQSSYLFWGIVSMAFGFALIFFPYMNFVDYYAFDMTALSQWLRLLGGIFVASGFIRFSQALIGKNVRLQQLFLVLYLVPQGLNIALIMQLHLNPAILRDGLLAIFPGADIGLYIMIGVIFVVIATIIGMIDEISKIIKLETIGFPEIEETTT